MERGLVVILMSLHNSSHPHHYWRILFLLLAFGLVVAFNNQVNLPDVLGLSTDMVDWGYVK